MDDGEQSRGSRNEAYPFKSSDSGIRSCKADTESDIILCAEILDQELLQRNGIVVFRVMAAVDQHLSDQF